MNSIKTTTESGENQKTVQSLRPLAGILLIIAGSLLFLDQYLKTQWLTLLILPAVGFSLYIFGIRMLHSGLLIAGGVLAGLGIGVAAALNPQTQPQSFLIQSGLLLAFLGLGWLAIAVGAFFALKKPYWWSLLPTGITLALGISLLFTQFLWSDIVFFASLGIAIPLLIWGLADRLYGLVIPGSLIIVIGPGVYIAWQVMQPNTLAQIGAMLVWFSLGWILITLFSRVMFNRYVWWPLIPGGILAMVGLGLYIGGDPDNALGFISNTGSIGLIIFGLYLLLMRKGIHP
jgi:hypothetical protein